MSVISNRKGEILQDPPIIQKLFNDSRAGWIWFLLRIWVGWQWISASEHKLTDPGWMRTGEALKGFWMNAVKIPATGRPPISFDWYRSFLMFLINAHSYTWFAKVISVGELLVGIGLILGAFTGIAAFFGAMMNFNFMLAGSASTNPVLFAIAIGLVMAWKVAGYVGADYYLLRWIGTPWQPVRYPQSAEGVVPAAKPASGD